MLRFIVIDIWYNLNNIKQNKKSLPKTFIKMIIIIKTKTKYRCQMGSCL